MVATPTDTEQLAGLFPVTYQVGTELPGAPVLTLHLLVSTPDERITGFARLTQATNPPLDVSSKLDGEFTYMTVMPDATHILVVLTGWPVLIPPGGGPGPVVQPDLQVRMVLASDWSSGTTTYRYADSDGQWTSVSDVPVASVGHLSATQA